jgi:hypothetical protein
MVENLVESSGMCSDGLGSAPIEILKREAFFEREQEREKGDDLGRVGERGVLLRFIPRPGSHRRAARADSPPRPRE